MEGDTLVRTFTILLDIMFFGIVIRSLLSWLPLSKANPVVRIIYQITEPILEPIRRLIEKTSFGKNSVIDVSPVIALLIIMILRNVIAAL